MTRFRLRNSWLALPFFVVLVSSCNTPLSLSGKKTPHEKYSEGLSEAGLTNTALGRNWISAAAAGLARPVAINLPYRETGFFAADDPRAAGFRFNLKKGEQVFVDVETTPKTGLRLFVEIWHQKDASPELLSYNDSLPVSIRQVIDADGSYLLRIQPELLQPVGYNLTISTGPSLAFPVRKEDNPKASSFWGANRDGGSRSHEGVDIFAKKGTPAIATGPGRVTRVNENRLGGKVVFIRPDGQDYSLYYAHLDSQIATEGQRVLQGDVIGLIGNTGNARTTPAHLHFGIYGPGGAIDPWPFINVNRPKPAAVSADTAQLGQMARIVAKHVDAASGVTMQAGTGASIVGASAGQYRVRLPDGTETYVNASSVTTKPLRTLTLKQSLTLYASPAADAAVIRQLMEGSVINVLSSFGTYSYVRSGNRSGWVSGI